MKLRDIVLGGAMITGLAGCASEPIWIGPNCPHSKSHLKPVNYTEGTVYEGYSLWNTLYGELILTNKKTGAILEIKDFNEDGIYECVRAVETNFNQEDVNKVVQRWKESTVQHKEF